MVKENFDRPLTSEELDKAVSIAQEAYQANVTTIINVGTSLVESINSVQIAKKILQCYAAVGIHPNDCTSSWHEDLKTIKNKWFKNQDFKEIYKIVAIGECGLDKHYPNYNIHRQRDAFKAQIELALEYDLALIVHTRDAGDEVLSIIDEYVKNNLRGIIHCFSEDMNFAKTAIEFGFLLGIGGTITYPKNISLREIVKNISLKDFVLETDAPFLPPQAIRGKQNSPKEIVTIAHYIAELQGEDFATIAQHTTDNAKKVFRL
jgi:TatD DNase family protein